MKKENLEDVTLKFNPVAEFITSLGRIALNKQFTKLRIKYGIRPENRITNWINSLLGLINNEYKELLNFYFNDKGYFGLGLVFMLNQFDDEITIQEFINYLQDTSAEELTYYLLIPGYEGELNKNMVKEIRHNEENMFNWIEDNFIVPKTGKWEIFKVLMQPEKVKKDLIDLLDYYYDSFYKNKEEDIDKIINEHLENNKKELKQAFIESVFDILSNEFKKYIFESEGKKEVHVSYFTEFGSYVSFGRDSLIIGYKYPKLVNKLKENNRDLINYLQIFKVLSDETRLKVLLEIAQSPKYLAEIAKKLDYSDPAVKYHLDRLLNEDLIEVDKAGNRIYYKLKEVQFQKFVKQINKSFKLE